MAKKKPKSRTAKPAPEPAIDPASSPVGLRFDGEISLGEQLVRLPPVELYPFNPDNDEMHKLAVDEVTAFHCEFGVNWGNHSWRRSEVSWTAVRFHLITDYRYTDQDLRSLSIPAMCKLFTYSYSRDLRALREGSKDVKLWRGDMQSHKDMAELSRKLKEIGLRVCDLLRQPSNRDHWTEQIRVLLRDRHEYDRRHSGGKEMTPQEECRIIKIIIAGPWPFSGFYRLLDLPRERPAAYTLIAQCLTQIGGKDIVREIADEMKIPWTWDGACWVPFFGRTAVLDMYIKDIEEDLQVWRLPRGVQEHAPIGGNVKTTIDAWPPAGYTRTNDLRGKWGVPIQTVRAWAEKDSGSGGDLEGRIKTRPHAREKAYPNDWLKSRMNGYKPRPK